MFEDIPIEAVELRFPFSDGTGNLVWKSLAARAARLGTVAERTPATSGIVAEKNSFLIFSATCPSPGTHLKWGETEYEIDSVRILRALSGLAVAYRCTCG